MRRTAIHPGEHLAEQLEALGISAAELGRRLQVPGNRISQIVAGQRNITSDTALRLGHYFGTSPQFWLDLQAAYDLRLAETKTGAAIKRLPTLTARRKRPSHAGPPPAALRGIARGADTQIKREPDRPL